MVKKALLLSRAAGGNGVPVRNGLVAEYKFDECRNLLKYSQQFDNAAWTKTDCAITANDAAAPDGTTTADKVTLTVGAAQSIAATYAVTAATAYTYSIWVKLGTAATAKYAVYDLTHSADIKAATSYAATTSWARYTYTFTTPAGCISISVRPVKDCGVNNGETLWLWGAQLEVGSSATTYVPTTDKQTLTDYSGNANHGTLGSTAGEDTNDPTWTGEGAYFTTDDAIVTPKSTTTIFTAIIACKVIANTMAGVISIGTTFSNAEGVALEHLTGAKWHVGANGVGRSAALTGVYTGNQVFAITRNGLDLSVFNVANPSDLVTYTAPLIIDTVNSNLFGNRGTVDTFLGGNIYYIAIYNRVLTQAEISKNYAYLKSYLKKNRGIALP